KDLIAQQVSELVVKALEVVDVNHDDRQAAVVTRSALDFRSDLHLEVTAVVDAGETVDVREMLGFFEVGSVLDRPSADVRDRFQRGNVFLREIAGAGALEH